VSFRRIINVPHRGIGAAALSKMELEARKKSLALFDALKCLLRGDNFASGVKARLSEFVKRIEHFSSSKYRSAADMMKDIFEKTGLADMLEEERIKNVEELVVSGEGRDAGDFLSAAALVTHLDDEAVGDCISLMTLHNAKGLEFPIVFITGLEEGILPYCKALDSEEEIAEERRLLYVGMTRAQEVLSLSGASRRRLYAKVQNQEPSRFLKDIPRECCQWVEKTAGQRVIRLEPVKKKVAAQDIFTIYTAGSRVKHPSWGIGVVRDCYGDGDDIKVMVNFPNIGIKRLAVRFANLEKI
jgi:DNA helicase-2/ATP-dependent DNA helicase PcrA